MMRFILSFKNYFWVLSLFLCGCTGSGSSPVVSSPDKNVLVTFFLNDEGMPGYKVGFKGATVIDSSLVGFDLKGMPYLGKDMTVVEVRNTTFNESWKMPWGEKLEVKNQYNQMRVCLKEKTEAGRTFNMVFRVYDDGLGFRYEFPDQEGMDEVIILDEDTHFNFTKNHTCWWIPGDWDIYEHLYQKTSLTEIDALSMRGDPNLGQTYIPQNAVNTPVTLKTEQGLYLSIHEADLTDYAGMTLKVDKKNIAFVSELVGSDRLGYKVKRSLPFETPWRTLQVTETAGELIESDLIVNLNDPNVLGDVSWIKPTKYMGIWWAMHLGVSSWDISSTQKGWNTDRDGDATDNRHGANTRNVKRYMDFASQNNIGALLVEGWNTGWEHWVGFEDREGVFDFVTPYADYDLPELVRYGREKGVEIIMHHETSAAPRTYEQQLDTAFSLMQSLGIHAVKSGYVGKIIPKGEYHHGQWMVNHYHKVIETAARYQVAVNAHEPIKATGKRRTYPNIISREGLRGQEYNAWASDGGNPPSHLPTVAFTRMLAGPIDYTPGIFNIKLEPYKKNNQVNTTLAQQLALYVVIYSPVQMAADLPESYSDHPALQFIREVGVDWQQSKVMNGEVGEYVTIAREERGTGDWFVGAITNEKSRELDINLSFLSPDQKYEAILYKDGPLAHWNDNPNDYVIEKMDVDASSLLSLKLASGGGCAISILKKQ